MTTEYKHDEYCNMLLTLGACNSFAGPNIQEFALHYAGRHHPDVNVFQTLQQRLHETRKCSINCTRKCRLPTDGMDTSQWSCHICSRGKKGWRSSRDIARVFIMPQQRVFHIILEDKLEPYHVSWDGHLFSDNHLLKPFCASVRGAQAFSISLRHFMVMFISKTKWFMIHFLQYFLLYI